MMKLVFKEDMSTTKMEGEVIRFQRKSRVRQKYPAVVWWLGNIEGMDMSYFKELDLIIENRELRKGMS